MRLAKTLEWVGLTIVKKYLSKITSDKMEDVHDNPNYFQKGIDLLLRHANGTTTTIDLKVDSYYGSDRNRKIRDYATRTVDSFFLRRSVSYNSIGKGNPMTTVR